MAYYSSNFHESGTGEYNWTPYSTSYNVVPNEAAITYSSFEFSEPKFIQYYPSTTYDDDDYGSSLTPPEIHYYTYNFSEPKVIEYEPTPYFSSQTQYMISYLTSEFNVPEYEEYNPAPYGGGYDLTLTYGKPLPPSDELCYPRSIPDANGLFLDGFSYGSIPSPYGKDGNDFDSMKPRNGSKPTDVSNLDEPLDADQGEEREGYSCDYDYPWSGYDYECEKQVPETPYGYDSDAMDFCQSIFGYWPCFCRKHQKSNGHQRVVAEGRNSNPWQGTSDYLFGSLSGYGERRDEGRYYGDSSYGHESYYQQPLAENDQNSLMHAFNIF